MQTKQRDVRRSVSIIVSRGWLQLRFSYGGKRHYISVGLRDTPTNRKIAEAKAKLIESDIIYERFDPTLEKYKPQTALSVTTTAAPLPVPKTSLLDLWEQYTQFQQVHLEETTIIRDYGKIEKRIRKFPKPYLEDAIAIQAHLLTEFAAETAKRTLKQLSACCNWAMRKKLISENPFKELAQEVKTKKTSKVSRKPFSKECVAAIISAFEHNTYCSKYSPIPHSYYAPYVKFLFHTGCRPEEAIALKWKHVEKNRIYICEAVATDVRIRKTTKTDTLRYFPINEELRAVFDAVRPENPDPNALVFPARGGKEIDTHNFLNRVWRPVVEKLVEAGKVKEYLPQYNCRHTFITLCLESGIISRRVADWCGTSVAVIEEHYAGAIAHIQVPSFGLTDQTTLED
ncbi:site-specific integrase [filamentous cyanobacterium CCP2]|nr:site-specific integrase [filamentous cyanobacterium CCP2]